MNKTANEILDKIYSKGLSSRPKGLTERWIKWIEGSSHISLDIREKLDRLYDNQCFRATVIMALHDQYGKVKGYNVYYKVEMRVLRWNGCIFQFTSNVKGKITHLREDRLNQDWWISKMWDQDE